MKQNWSIRRSLILIAAAFLLWGMLRSLDDVIIPVFQTIKHLSYAAAMLVHLSFFSAYVLVARPASHLVERHGYRAALIWSTSLMALGAAFFIPVALYLSFPLCLIAVSVFASGITVLQVSANAWITLLGDAHSAARRLLIIQAFISVGSVVGPVLGRVLLPVHGFMPSARTPQFPSAWVEAIYSACAIALSILAILLARWFANDAVSTPGRRNTSWLTLMRQRSVLCGFLAIFLGVGAEAAILGHAIRFFSSAASDGFHPRTAALLLSAYWMSVMIGRFAAAYALERYELRLLLSIAAFCATLAVSAVFVSPGWVTSVALLSTGFFNALMFPAIFTRTVLRSSASVAPAISGLLTTAISGGAVLPLLSGALADHYGVTAAFLPPMAAYLLIGIYALTSAL